MRVGCGSRRNAAAAATLALTCWLGICAVLLCAGPARAALPEEYGPFPVRETGVQIPVPVDPSGPEGVFTSLNADVYVPQTPGPWPLIQISHAWPGTLREFPLSGWAGRLASRGFVVIVSDRRGGSNLASASVGSEDILRILRWAISQNQVARSPLQGQVDASRIAIAGHSLGGYLATFAALRSQSEGPQISALALLDPSDERLGQYTLESSLAVSPSVAVPTIVLASEENQHPVMCNIDDGSDCTLVAPQQYAALTDTSTRIGAKVLGSQHEDVEDPKTTTNSPIYLQMYERYAMAFLEYELTGDCTAARYLGGAAARPDVRARHIQFLPGSAHTRGCRWAHAKTSSRA
jgi:dienelactone hydrolase